MPYRPHSRIRREGSTREERLIGQASKTASTLTSNIYGSFKGRLYGSWITDGGRSVGYATTDFIEQPAYIIESILRDELGLTSSEIDTASFDVVGNTSNGKRNGWKFVRSINSVENSLGLISRLCFESHCMRCEGNDGKIKLISLDTDVSTTNLIVESQLNSEPKILRFPVEKVFNQFNIGYHYNYASGVFEKSIICDEAVSSFESYTTLITNGLFGTDVTGWSNYNTGSVALSSNAMAITSAAANDGTYQTATVPIVSGKSYLITFTQTIGSGTWKLRLPKTASHSGTIIGGATEQTISAGSTSYRFTASETASAYFLFYCTTAGTNTLTVDNIVMKQVDFDYSTFTPDEASTIVSYGANATTSLCGISQSRYLWVNNFTENLLWVNDEATAKYFTKKIIEWLYAKRIMLSVNGWRGNSFTTGYKPLVAYEFGDQLKIDHPILDPDISNNFIFMVVGKSISLNNNDVTLTLLQMR